MLGCRIFLSNAQHAQGIVLCTVLYLMSFFSFFCNFFIFFHLSHMILEVELTRNIDIKNDGLTGTRDMSTVQVATFKMNNITW